MKKRKKKKRPARPLPPKPAPDKSKEEPAEVPSSSTPSAVKAISLRSSLALAVLPLLLLASGAGMIAIYGPHSLGRNLDPEFHYLFNATRLADLNIPPSYQHPGVPLLVLGALLITGGRLYEGLSGAWAPNIASAITQSEGYLTAMVGVHLVLLVVLCHLTGRRIAKLTGSVWPALALQISPFLSFMTLRFLGRMSPEPVQMIIVMGLVYVLAPVTLGDSPEDGKDPRRALLTGLLLALGIATKYNFVSLCVLILLFPGWKQKMRVATACAAALVVLLIPVFASFTAFQGFTASMISASGSGSGQAGLGAAGLLRDVEKVLSRSIIVSWAIPFYLLVALLVWVLARRSSDQRFTNARRALWAGSAVIVAHLVLTTLRIRAHYLIPALAATWFVNPHLVELLRRPPLHRTARWGIAACAVLLAGFALRDTQRRFIRYAGDFGRYRDQLALIEQKRQQMSDCFVTGAYRSSAPGYALQFGNSFSRLYYAAALEQAYPGQGWFDLWRQDYVNWAGKSRYSDLYRAVQAGQCVLYQGAPHTVYQLFGFQARPVLVPEPRLQDGEGLYQLSADACQPVLWSTEQPFRRARIIEARNFKRGNLVVDKQDMPQTVRSITTPAFAEYSLRAAYQGMGAIRIRYAVVDSRPIRVLLNGDLVAEAACSAPTGGGDDGNQKWQDLGMHPFRAGENVLRLESTGPFPRVSQIAYRVVP